MTARGILSHRVLGFALLGVVTGCAGDSRRPMATSLSDLAYETTSRETQMLGYHEIISVAGTLPIPDAGSLYYYPEPKLAPLQVVGRWIGNFFWRPTGGFSPAYMIPISDSHEDTSFVLSTECTAVTSNEQVKTLARSIGNLQDAIAESVRLTMMIGSLDAQAAAQMYPLSTNEFSVARSNLVARLEASDAAITNLQAKVRDESSQPGIIVARWVVASDAAGKLGLGQVAGLTRHRRSVQSGYIVLGGWRVSSVYFGRDFVVMLAKLGDADLALLKHANAGFVSYAVQAKHISYVSGLDLQSSIGAYANLHLRNYEKILQDIDQINLAGYSAKAQNLSNAGNLGGTSVTKTNLLYAGFIDGSVTNPFPNVALADAFDRATTNEHFRARPQPLFSNVLTNDSWKTVQAMVVSPPRLATVLHDALERHAAEREAEKKKKHAAEREAEKKKKHAAEREAEKKKKEASLKAEQKHQKTGKEQTQRREGQDAGQGQGNKPPTG